MIEWIKNKFAALRLRLKGWKTWIINIALAILPVLQATEFANVLPTWVFPYYALSMVVVNLFLRTQTTGPVGSKQGLE